MTTAPQTRRSPGTSNAYSQEEYDKALQELYAGRPRYFIEHFLWIRNLEGRLVRMALTSNQAYYDDETFAQLGSFDEAMHVLVAKDRKAESTSFWVAAAFAFASRIPLFDALIIADSDDTAQFELSMTDVFYNNLPKALQTPKKHWDQSFREFKFLDEHGNEKYTSSITVSSSRSPNFGRGRTPKMVVYSEMAHYARNFERRVLTSIGDSMGPSAWVIKESTPYGSRGQFYEDYKSIRDGKIAGKILRRYWFLNSKNMYPPGHKLIRPIDVDGITRTEEELLLCEKFPDDGVDPIARILWRRSKRQEAIQRSSGDEEVGVALFSQEHAEDSLGMWSGAEFSPIRIVRRTEMVNSCRPSLSGEHGDMVKPGFYQRVWEHKRLGGVYVGILDPAKGSASSDPTAFGVFNAVTGEVVAEIFGRTPLPDAVDACLTLLARYQMGGLPMFVPETNALGADVPEWAFRWGWPRDRVWRVPIKPTQNPLNPLVYNRSYGFETGATYSKAAMMGEFFKQVNEGRIIAYGMEIVQDWASYGEEEMKAGLHTPDRSIWGAIFSVLREQFANPLLEMAGNATREPTAGRY